MDSSKMWLKLNRMHRDLKMTSYSIKGTNPPLEKNITTIINELQLALEILKKEIEK